MSYEPNTHTSQTAILRHLLFVPGALFVELQKTTELTSDHFAFHIKKLIEHGYVEKEDKIYRLTPKGKEYANRMDTDDNTIERQPKLSILITLERKGEKGERQFFFSSVRKILTMIFGDV